MREEAAFRTAEGCLFASAGVDSCNSTYAFEEMPISNEENITNLDTFCGSERARHRRRPRKPHPRRDWQFLQRPKRSIRAFFGIPSCAKTRPF